jgi:hypothetical protein
MEQGDFLEGIRAAIIDKDAPSALAPSGPRRGAPGDEAAMLAPLGPDELTFDGGDRHEDRVHRPGQHGRAHGGQSGRRRAQVTGFDTAARCPRA